MGDNGTGVKERIDKKETMPPKHEPEKLISLDTGRKIAIIGTAESIDQAPYEDKTWEIWGCAPALTYTQFKRWDVVFEMHDREYWSDPKILGRLNETAGCPVYMQDHFKEIPKSKKYPLDNFCQLHNSNN